MLKKNQAYKIIPRKLITMLALGGASLFASCEKDEPIVQHDTTYTFTTDDYSLIWPTREKIQASADSAQVRNVIIKASGTFKSWGKGDIRNAVRDGLKPSFAISPKVKGAGTMDIWYQDIRPEDKQWLEARGYTIVEKWGLPEQNQR